MNYHIISYQKKSSQISQLSIIKNKDPPNDLLIAKIFYIGYEKYYIDEKNNLSKFSSKNQNSEYIINLIEKNLTIDLIDIENENITYQSKYLVFNYLKHGNISKYLQDIFNPIPECFVQIIAYKLLKGLKTIHEKNVCHNKLDIKNIMFDDKYNPIIIHFREAKEKTDFSEDFIRLAKTLAVIITNGQFKNSQYVQKKGYFMIKTNCQKCIEGNKFWNSCNNKISQEFIDFFKTLAMPNCVHNINELFKNKWFEKINNDSQYFEETEKNLQIFFEDRYQKLLSFIEQEKQNIDVSSIIDTDKSDIFKPNLIDFSNMRSIGPENNKKIKEIKHELKGILFDYVEINLTSNDNFDDNSFFNRFRTELVEALENHPELKKVEINDNEDLGFIMDFNNCIEGQNLGENFDEGEEEKLNLSIEVEILKYIPDDDNTKYYLVMNLLKGDILDYYHYLKIIKDEANTTIQNLTE